MADAHKNFAYGTVLTAPSTPTAGTSLVLNAGQGANMPTPPFNGTIWPSGAIPLASNAEIVRVTAVSTDTLTIVRTQEGSASRTVLVGDQFAAGITVKTLTDVEAYTNPAGAIIAYSGITAPANWLMCNGQAVSRTTYATLFNLYNPNLGNATISNASPAVVTLTAHGLQNGDTVFFTTTGTLPTGLSPNTIYYVTSTGANTFQLSTSTGGVGVIYINTTSAGSGTHTVFRSLYGLGDGSTTFNVPDLRGRVIGGVENMGGGGNASRLTGFANAPPNPLALGNAGGVETVTLTQTQMPSHTHVTDASGNVLRTGGGTSANLSVGGGSYASGPSDVTGSTGGDGAHNNVQPTLLMNYIVKT